MRVIAGSARGLRLVEPQGDATRPITDRVKESLFGLVGARVLDARVLDLYAGSGAIGIEALSRGASACTFVERDRRALTALRENLRRTQQEAQATVIGLTIERFLRAPQGGPWDLVILDPPYAERAILAPLERLTAHLAPAGLVVVKHFWRTEVPAPVGLVERRARRYGETALTFLEVA